MNRRAPSSLMPGIRLLAAVGLVTASPAEGQRILEVKHQPYLQLGDAPLAHTGSGIGDTDQIVIVWQTIETGTGDPPDDFFEVMYRRVGDPTATPAAPITTLDCGVETRVNHAVTITGLGYGEQYEYRVIHKRHPGSPVEVAAYAGTFRTRAPAGDPGPFTFAVTGDHVHDQLPETLLRFEAVMARVAALDPAFVVLTGDGVQNVGTHAEYDYRFDDSLVPHQSAFVRNHIEYYSMGNHEAYTDSGQPALDDYHVPIPVEGLTSPVAGAAGEPSERNYSYDHGLVHFVVFDSTAWGGPDESDARQAAIRAWIEADLDASDQTWKIVTGHHPPKSGVGRADTPGDMAAELVPLLAQHGADLLLCGHMHNYQRSYPLTGHDGSDVTHLTEASPLLVDRDLVIQGEHVIEVVVAPGGMAFDGDAPDPLPGWLAVGLGQNNGGQAGPLRVEVTSDALTIQYIAAGDGAVLDEFVIHVPAPVITLSETSFDRTAFRGDPLPADTFTVANTGIDELDYEIAVDADWLSVLPTVGGSTGEADPIDINYEGVPDLPVGEYTATITVSSGHAVNSPQPLQVNLTVETVSPDFDGDTDVDQEDFGHLQACLTGEGTEQTDPACFDTLLDDDNDVDRNDVDIFKSCHSGANVPAERTCDE